MSLLGTAGRKNEASVKITLDENWNELLLRLPGDDRGKKSGACAERSIRSTVVELSRGLNSIASNPIRFDFLSD